MKFLMGFLAVLFVALPSFGYQNYNCKIKNQSELSINSSALALATNAARKCLIIQPRGSSTVYIKFKSAHSGTEGIAIVGGTTMEFQNPPMDAVYLKSSAGAVTTEVLEGE